MPTTKSYASLLSAFALIGAGGCASAPPPDAEIARATSQIEQAQQAGAGEFAAVELQAATNNLRLAQTAADKGHRDEARKLAARSELDGQLAESKARTQQSAKSAMAVQKGTETLQRESDRALDATPAPIATSAEEPK